MRAASALVGVAVLAALARAAPTFDVPQVALQQQPLSTAPLAKGPLQQQPTPLATGPTRPPSHLSEWTRSAKADFLAALHAGNASEHVLGASVQPIVLR